MRGQHPFVVFQYESSIVILSSEQDSTVNGWILPTAWSVDTLDLLPVDLARVDMYI